MCHRTQINVNQYTICKKLWQTKEKLMYMAIKNQSTKNQWKNYTGIDSKVDL